MKRCIKKFIHKFIVDEKGAVSIFLIMITLLLFFFNAVLIDYARIMVADRQTDQAAKVALRSTMSSYNQGLQDKGLFAFNGEQGDATALFQTVFEKNIQAGDGEGFHFVDLQAEESEITTNLNLDRGLANKEVFEHQILEEMKYQAPIEIGESILESFLSISDEMEQASVYVDIIKEIEDDVESREEKLDKATELIKEAKEKLESIDTEINSTSVSAYPVVNNLQDIFNGHTKYLDVYPINPPADDGDDEEKTNEEKEKETEDKRKADNFKGNAAALLTRLINVSTEAKDKLMEALELIKEAETLNNTVKTTIDNAKDSKQESYQNAQNENRGDDLGDDSGLNNAMDSVDDYVLDKEMFTTLIDKVQSAIDKLESDNNRTDELIPKLEEIKKGVDDGFHSKRHNELRNAIQDQVRIYYRDTLNLINEALEILEQGRAEFKDDGLEEKEEEADDNLEDLKDKMDSIQDDYENISGDTETYQKLAERVIKYHGAIEENGEKFELEDREDTADDAMNFIDMLFENLGEKLISARDELYINEYVLTRFASHTFPTDGTAGYKFENNQVEYIIYGQASFGANYMAALSEIFAVRFAINFVAALMDTKNKVFGPYMWVAALANAFGKTIDNMNDITNGRKVELFPGKTRPQWGYEEHLRLFLFAHPTGKKTERIMAVIDHDTETDLTKSSTYINANATSSIRLWFLPGLAEMLGKTGAIDGRVEGNRYFIEKEVNYSY
ncbi:DUF5702 domain-containing protein [Oceanobacillus chungangensis]|uniref:Uncharacterized protein n=1 Tax=Oceanobacillus chungangensis TaxID=1229152 RepID=A0A3D8Q287_9BACI|nr:DUF5702 domain-containing protein [Oceanobacillus chungangensis]RDW21718.1 hypothetical protein CWR45_02265 [Oceanobacillus chungangensis]